VGVGSCGCSSWENLVRYYFFVVGSSGCRQWLLLDICRNNLLSPADINSSMLRVRQQRSWKYSTVAVMCQTLFICRRKFCGG